MAVTLNALTTGVGGLQTTGDTSGEISLQSNGSTVLAVTSGGAAVTGTLTVGGNAVLNAGTTVTVAQGGTGVSTLTTAYGVLAAGTTATGALQNIGTGTSTQVLTSNGPGVLPTFQALPASGGQIQTQIFTSPGTWTKPSSATQVRVTVIGGGGTSPSPGSIGSPGGVVIAIVPVSAPVAVTVGSGQPSGGGASGTTSSFGALATATGGNNAGTSGTGSTTGTALLTTNAGIGNPGTAGGVVSFGVIVGSNARSGAWPSPAIAYTVSGGTMAGVGGNYLPPLAQSAASYSGVVVVEFVG